MTHWAPADDTLAQTVVVIETASHKAVAQLDANRALNFDFDLSSEPTRPVSKGRHALCWDVPRAAFACVRHSPFPSAARKLRKVFAGVRQGVVAVERMRAERFEFVDQLFHLLALAQGDGVQLDDAQIGFVLLLFSGQCHGQIFP